MDVGQREQVGRAVAAARESRGWSQRDLAREAGVSENTVLSIERATRLTQPAKLRRVLDAVGLAPAQGRSLDLDEIPEDVAAFVRVFIRRMEILDEDERARVLARLYPAVLELSVSR